MTNLNETEEVLNYSHATADQPWNGEQDTTQDFAGKFTFAPARTTAEKTTDTTALEAVQFARDESAATNRGETNWYRLCLSFVRTAWGLPPVEPTARHAWENAQHKHAWSGDTEDIPFGAPVFSTRPGAGPDDSGHVFICCGHSKNGKRLFRSNDVKVLGGIDAVHIDFFTDVWGHKILGWTEDLNGYELNLPDSPNERKAKARAQKNPPAKKPPVKKPRGKAPAKKSVARRGTN